MSGRKTSNQRAVDIKTTGDSEYFRSYVESRSLEERISTYWGVDQSDQAKLRKIVVSEFSGPLDLVLDDASHLFAETKTSFETLFPMLRPGGLYIIEDWAWSYFEEYQAPGHPWSEMPELAKLVFQLTEVAGSTQSFADRVREEPQGSETVRNALISEITIFPHFVAIQRGDLPQAELRDFALEDFISRRPSRLKAKLSRWRRASRHKAGRLLVGDPRPVPNRLIGKATGAQPAPSRRSANSRTAPRPPRCSSWMPASAFAAEAASAGAAARPAMAMGATSGWSSPT